MLGEPYALRGGLFWLLELKEQRDGRRWMRRPSGTVIMLVGWPSPN